MNMHSVIKNLEVEFWKAFNEAFKDIPGLEPVDFRNLKIIEKKQNNIFLTWIKEIIKVFYCYIDINREKLQLFSSLSFLKRNLSITNRLYLISPIKKKLQYYV